MTKRSFSCREWLAAAVLLIIFLAALYHMTFRLPLRKELAAIEAQAQILDEQLEEAVSRVAQMEQMRTHLEEIRSRPPEQITEIAPFDNKEAVLRQLNQILRPSDEYRLTFLETAAGSDGLVRRSVVMDFTCTDFATAWEIVDNLSRGPWRCLVGNLSLTGAPDVMSGTVTVSATVIYFESTLLSVSRP